MGLNVLMTAEQGGRACRGRDSEGRKEKAEVKGRPPGALPPSCLRPPGDPGGRVAGDLQGGGQGLRRRISYKVDLIKNHSPFCNLHLQFSCSFGKRPHAAVLPRGPVPGEPRGRARCLPAARLTATGLTVSSLPAFLSAGF